MTTQKSFPTFIVIGPMPFRWETLRAHLKKPNVELFFIDGGSIHRPKFSKKVPQLMKSALNLGDGDSSKLKMDIKKTDQNLSDLDFFLKKMFSLKKIGNYLFVGFLGGRLDHELLNLSVITRFAEKINKKNLHQISIENKIQLLSPGKNEFNFIGPFSLISFEKNKIKISGECVYKTRGWISLSPLDSRGLSNNAQGTIVLETLKAIALFHL